MDDKKINRVLIIAVIVLLLLTVFNCNKSRNLRVDNNILEQNKKALSDSIRVTKNKLGEIEYSKNILVSDKKDLKDLNADLANELSKEKGKVSELTKYVISIKNKPKDTIKVPNYIAVYPDGVKGLKWDYEKIYDANNYRKISGVSKFKIDTTNLSIIPLNTEIINDEINFDVIQGLREKDGNVEMFVRSNYPGFKVSELNSVIIDPKTHPVLKKFTKKKRFGVGTYAGYGLYIDNFKGTVGFGAQIGVGLSYNLFNF